MPQAGADRDDDTDEDRLRACFDGCHEDLVWDLVRGGDHDKEDRALDKKKALAILDCLTERPACTRPPS